MHTTYSITEAQARLPALVREAQGGVVPIARRGQTVAYLISRQRLEAIAETLELLADAGAMEAIRAAQADRTRYVPLDEDDAD